MLRIRRILTTSFLVAVLALTLLASAALAAINIHSSSVTFSGDTVTATYDVSGLGNQGATLQITAVGFATYTCTNKGGNAAPGQNPQPATGTSPGVAFEPTGRPGRATATESVTLTAPQEINAKQAGCPGNNWTATLNDVVLTGATVTITDNSNNQVIYQQFFDNPNN